jgi:hypothetical protein
MFQITAYGVYLFFFFGFRSSFFMIFSLLSTFYPFIFPNKLFFAKS